MRWHSALPDRLGALVFRARRRWLRWRYGEPPDCDDCGGPPHFASCGDRDEYLCVSCLDDRGPADPLGVRDIDPARDWGR